MRILCKHVNSHVVKQYFQQLNDVNRKVKQEGAYYSNGSKQTTNSKTSNGSKARFATPSYIGDILELFVGNGTLNFIKKKFMEKYGFCFKRLNPKQVKVCKDYTKEKATKVFGPTLNKNGY